MPAHRPAAHPNVTPLGRDQAIFFCANVADKGPAYVTEEHTSHEENSYCHQCLGFLMGASLAYARGGGHGGGGHGNSHCGGSHHGQSSSHAHHSASPHLSSGKRQVHRERSCSTSPRHAQVHIARSHQAR